MNDGNEAIERLKCMRLFMKFEDKENKSKFLDSDYEANHMAINSMAMAMYMLAYVHHVT